MTHDRSDHPRCPVCGSPVFDVYRRCDSCDTPHHPECWDYLGGCAIYGCHGGAWRRPPLRRQAPALADLVDELRVLVGREAQALGRLTRALAVVVLGTVPAVGACALWAVAGASPTRDAILGVLVGALPYTVGLGLVGAAAMAWGVPRLANRWADERTAIIDRIRGIMGADLSSPYPFGALLTMVRRRRGIGDEEGVGAVLSGLVVLLAPYWLVATDLAPLGALGFVLAGAAGAMAATFHEEACLLRLAPDLFEDIIVEGLRHAEDWEDDLP